MEHLLHRLYGVDAPACITKTKFSNFNMADQCHIGKILLP